MTSSSRGIVPIVAINGQTIAGGAPGPVTRQLRQAYQAWLSNPFTGTLAQT